MAFILRLGTPCLCHYAGTLMDGTEFDSSYSRGEPTNFAPNQVIKAWTEAMQIMVEGEKWELYIPSDLAYGDRLTPKRITNIIASFAIVNLFITPLCLINIRTYTHKIRLPL